MCTCVHIFPIDLGAIEQTVFVCLIVFVCFLYVLIFNLERNNWRIFFHKMIACCTHSRTS